MQLLKNVAYGVIEKGVDKGSDWRPSVDQNKSCTFFESKEHLEFLKIMLTTFHRQW